MSLLLRVRRALEPTFAVERELGAGGMGIVFEAHDTKLQRQVAVKVLRPESATAVAAQRFLREARLLARVKHPNVVHVHQAGEGEGLYWFVMDKVDGETLSSRLQRGPLTERETLSIAKELLSALEVAHEHGIVHRDIKPSNIFLEKGRALLADFGIARTTTTSEGDLVTGTKELIGTPAYMAPEQMTGGRAGPQADLYSLAVVLYECLAGKRWPALQAVGSGEWRSVPSSMNAALRRAMSADPAQRWPDARSMAAALKPRRKLWPFVALAGAAAAAVALYVLLKPPAADSSPYAPGAVVPVTRAGRAAWTKAEKLFLSAAWDAADTAYRGALASDPDCLACEFRLLEVDSWLERRPDSARHERLWQGRHRFSEPWLKLVEARLAPFSKRLELLENLTNDYRDWPLAWYYRGFELFNRGGLSGRGWKEANEALTQLHQLDSAFAPAWTDLTLVRIAVGDSAGAGTMLDRLQSLPRADGLAQAQRLLAGLAFAFRFTPHGLAAWQEVASDRSQLQGLPEVAVGPRVLTGLGTPSGAVQLGRAFETTPETPLQRSGLIAQALGFVALGQLDSARAAGRRLNYIFPSQQLAAFAAMLDAAAVLFDPASTASDATKVVESLRPFSQPSGFAPQVRRDAAWMLALAALERREPAAVQAALSLVADEPEPRFRNTFIRALLLGASGEEDSALALTNTIVSNIEAWDATERSPFLRAAIHLSRASWFTATGGPENARIEYRWYQHFHLPDYPVDAPLPADGDWAFSTLAAWSQARLLDRGEADTDVCTSYRMVAARWAEGDPRYRARADTARGRITDLRCP